MAQWPTVDGFLRRLKFTGVSDIVNATTLVTVDNPGLPGFDAFINGCKPSDIPIINQAYVATFNGEPGTAAFLFRSTDFGLTENIVAELCDEPVDLNTTAAVPCPSYNNATCQVSLGMQLSFDALRDQLLPAWQTLAGVSNTTLPSRIICAGHSRGAQLSALCAVFMRALAPKADQTAVLSGSSPFANAAFENFYASSVNESWVITNSCDPFPTLPDPASAGLSFLPSPIWLVPIRFLDVTTTRAFAYQRSPEYLYFNVFDHFTVSYLAAIDAALENAPA
eukprot:jgi/Botrbrau1/15085/Bobra.0221s0004.1